MTPQGANGLKRTAGPCPCGCGRRITARTCFVSYRCRHDACVDANRRYARRNSKMHTMGKPSPFVDAGPLLDRLMQFSAEGVGYKQVATYAGVAKSSLSGVMGGKRHRVRRETADAVLALPIDPTRQAADKALIDARPTWNRLHALMMIGWSAQALSDRLGRSPKTRALQFDEDRVYARNARQVLALFNELRDTPGPTPLTGRRYHRDAMRDGEWPTPADLDDRGFVIPALVDDDDGPDIDQVAIDRRYEGCWSVKLNRDERIEAIRQGFARGLNRTEISKALGFSSQTVAALLPDVPAAPNPAA